MRSSSLSLYLGIALSVGVSLAACSGDDDDDDVGKTSAEGQSCQSAADCASNLVCVDLTCVTPGSSSAGNGGRGGAAGSANRGGSAGTPPVLVLGREGESCTKRADCGADLHCFNQRCTTGDETGAAGGGGTDSEPPPLPTLGQLGETCLLSSDCEEGLTCLPGATPGQAGVGVCSIAHTGIRPTGKACVGECVTATDCCQIPIQLHAVLGVKSCADLEARLGSPDCADAPSPAPNLCFAQATYCECDDTWACNANLCNYRPECSANGLTTEGCPRYTRSGREMPETCIDSQCSAPAPIATCTEDDECETTTVADDPTDTCSADECTCHEADGKCYRKCDSHLDCAVGFHCDSEETQVCVAGEQCPDNIFCQKQLKDVNAVCNAGQCQTGCNSDLDCNASLTQFTRVCNPQTRVCEDPGCRSDTDCFGTGVQMFCIDAPTPGAPGSVASAITD